MDAITVISENAIGLTAYRFLSDDRARAYKPIYLVGNSDARLLVHRANVLGFIANSKDDAAGAVDFMDENGDTVDDIQLTKRGLNWLIRTMKLRVDYEDGQSAQQQGE